MWQPKSILQQRRLAHLNEFADYYTRLEKMEREAEEEKDHE